MQYRLIGDLVLRSEIAREFSDCNPTPLPLREGLGEGLGACHVIELSIRPLTLRARLNLLCPLDCR